MKHKVLILGTLGEFTELVKKAKEKGPATPTMFLEKRDIYSSQYSETFPSEIFSMKQ